MKIFSFISSIIAFLSTLIFLIIDFPDLDNFSGILYLAIFIILIAICLTGILFNMPVILKMHKKHGY